MEKGTTTLIKKQAIIIGAGPAGLTAAYELLKQTDIHPVVMEATYEIGGISKTVEYHGNHIDIGGHRFFSKNDTVMKWWQDIMPLQGKAAKDELLLGENPQTVENGADPEQTDRVMLQRRRVSRIYYLRHFFDYPISLSWQTFANMGLPRTLKVGFGYLATLFHKLSETSLENFYINRFDIWNVNTEQEYHESK